MRQRRCRLSLLLATFLLAWGADRAQAQGGRVGGSVRDETGEPVKGVTITAENVNIGRSVTSTTDDKGRFTVLGLRGGRWRFVAIAPGFAPEAGMMSVRSGSPNPPIVFVLKRSGSAAFGLLGGISGKDLQEDLTAADAIFEEQRWDDSVDAYRDVMERSPALAVINLQIAAAYRNKKDYDRAVAAYRDLLEFDPDNGKAIIGLAAVEDERGNPGAAEDVLTRAVTEGHADRDVFFALGERKMAAHEADEAIRWYQRASDADPAWGKPLYKLGLCAITKGNNSDATKLLTQAITVDPTSPEAALAQSSLELLNK
jgi:Flp pilus assembly protein TadD